MERKVFILVVLATLSLSLYAIKPEKELNKLYVGMPLNEVKQLFGDPKYSQYDKKSKIRMLLYDFYKTEGGFAEYHLYLQNDSLIYLMLSADKKEVRQPIDGDTEYVYNEEGKGSYVEVNDYTIEGKSLVVTKIIENITLTNEQIVDAVIVAISRACNGSQGEFKVKEPTRILYHGIIDKVITFDWRWGSINIFYSVDVAIKQGRVRVKIIGEEIDWHQDHEKATYYFSETYPIGTISMKGVSSTEAQEMVRNTSKQFHQYISVIEEELSKTVEDDW